MRLILSNSRGQSLIEYVILVALVGCATIGMVRLLQRAVKIDLANVIHTMQGDQQRVQAEKIDDQNMKKADFTDFMNGAASRE